MRVWLLSSCHSLLAEHWQLKSAVLGSISGCCWLSIPYYRFIISCTASDCCCGIFVQLCRQQSLRMNSYLHLKTHILLIDVHGMHITCCVTAIFCSCWISVEKGTIFAFVAPALVIILVCIQVDQIAVNTDQLSLFQISYVEHSICCSSEIQTCNSLQLSIITIHAIIFMENCAISGKCDISVFCCAKPLEEQTTSLEYQGVKDKS